MVPDHVDVRVQLLKSDAQAPGLQHDGRRRHPFAQEDGAPPVIKINLVFTNSFVCAQLLPMSRGGVGRGREPGPLRAASAAVTAVGSGTDRQPNKRKKP